MTKRQQITQMQGILIKFLQHCEDLIDAGEKLSIDIQELQEFCSHCANNLNGKDPTEFTYLDFQIRNGFLAYCYQGIALEKIAHHRAYEPEKGGDFYSFKDYCEYGLKLSVFKAQQLMKAARNTLNLICEGFEILPQSYSVAAALPSDLIDSSGELINDLSTAEAWEEAIALSGGRPGVKHVNAVVHPEKEATNTVPIEGSKYEFLKEKAAELGISIKEMMARFIDFCQDKFDQFMNDFDPEFEPEKVKSPPLRKTKRSKNSEPEAKTKELESRYQFPFNYFDSS